MNSFIVVGRLTRDPEFKDYTNNALCTFTLAVDRNYSKAKREEAEASNKPTADFIGISVWGSMAQNCHRYLSKGSQCAVSGRIQTSKYQDQQTGEERFGTHFIADNVEFLSSPNKDNRPNNQNIGDDFFEDDWQEIEENSKIQF